MDNRVWVLLALATLMMMGLWASSGLQDRAHESQLRVLHNVMDEMDRDMGTYDSAAARNTPVFERMRQNIDLANRHALRNRQLLDSLSRECKREFGMPEDMNVDAPPITMAER
ncbi:hypothetical protein HZB60_03065 [candidate division KSB1 bacterium]|nr:hypothetical protein [candidate division KSB1 bacterium]